MSGTGADDDWPRRHVSPVRGKVAAGRGGAGQDAAAGPLVDQRFRAPTPEKRNASRSRASISSTLI